MNATFHLYRQHLLLDLLLGSSTGSPVIKCIINTLHGVHLHQGATLGILGKRSKRARGKEKSSRTYNHHHLIPGMVDEKK